MLTDFRYYILFTATGMHLHFGYTFVKVTKFNKYSSNFMTPNYKLIYIVMYYRYIDAICTQAFDSMRYKIIKFKNYKIMIMSYCFEQYILPPCPAWADLKTISTLKT